MDIEREIKNIISRYDMNIDADRLYVDLLKGYLEEKIGSSKNTAIMCAGIHSTHILQDFSDVLTPICFMDNNEKRINEQINGIDIVGREHASKFDKILISTFDYRKEVREQLVKEGIEEDKLIDIYSFLEENGIEPWIEYYNITANNPYVIFIIINNLYEKKQNPFYLKTLIKLYLKIRDIDSACLYMKEYMQNKYEDYVEIHNLLFEVERLIESIRKAFENRNHKDIVWFWQDGLLYDWTEKMPFYKELKDKAMYFTGAYSSTVWSRCVYELILHKRYEIDDISFKHYGKIDCKWIKELEKRGYDCVRVNVPQRTIEPWKEFECGIKPLISFEEATSEIYWKTINYILNSEKSVFVLAHSVLECHMPICSPRLIAYNANWANLPERFEKDIREKFMRNVTTSVEYLSELVRFYTSLLGKNAVKIYMSDHGSLQEIYSRRWNKDANHFVFIVEGKSIKAKICERLFSLYNFDKVIKYIVSPTEDNFEEIFSEYISLQSVDVYNEYSIKKYLGTEFLEYCYSFRGIQTLEDRYVLLKNGKEVYNIFPDDYTNYIDNPEYQKRIQELRELAGNNFISNDEEKFKAAKILYQ